MRRLAIGLAIVVMVLLFASVASAVPSEFCKDKPDHPQCTTTTEPSSTTPTTTESPQFEPCPTGTFTVPGIRKTDFECLWKPAFVEGAEVATVTISNLDIPRPPTLFVRDDGPGDICIFEYQWENQNGPQYVDSFKLLYDEVPVPTPQDPDVLDYSAWLGHSYWDFVLDPTADPAMEAGTHWCAPQDPVLWSIREDNNGGALLLTVLFDAKRGGSLDITLFPENSL